MSQNSPLQVVSTRVRRLHRAGLDILFNDGVLDGDFAVVEVVPDVERHPLRIVLVHRVKLELC